MEKTSNLKQEIINTLDSNKALDIIAIDLEGKSSIADYMIIASGTSSRHIQALSEQVFEKLANNRFIVRKMEQYKISNSLRLTIGNEKINKSFIKTIGSILK